MDVRAVPLLRTSTTSSYLSSTSTATSELNGRREDKLRVSEYTCIIPDSADKLFINGKQIPPILPRDFLGIFPT
jgi:hypothetical protein